MKKKYLIIPLLILVFLFTSCLIVYDPEDQNLEFRNYKIDVNANAAILKSGKTNQNINNICAGKMDSAESDVLYPLASCIAYKMIGTSDEIKEDSVAFADYCLTTAYNYIAEKKDFDNHPKSIESFNPYTFGTSETEFLTPFELLFYKKDSKELVAFELDDNYLVVGGYDGEIVYISKEELSNDGYIKYDTRYCNRYLNGSGTISNNDYGLSCYNNE